MDWTPCSPLLLCCAALPTAPPPPASQLLLSKAAGWLPHLPGLQGTPQDTSYRTLLRCSFILSFPDHCLISVASISNFEGIRLVVPFGGNRHIMNVWQACGLLPLPSQLCQVSGQPPGQLSQQGSGHPTLSRGCGQQG